jgi:Family of unknown function (DUF5996)
MLHHSTSRPEDWPSLPAAAWDETRATLHMWTQIIGKIRLARAPMINHWWQVPLYVTSRGLTTSPIPNGARTFQIDLDFIEHKLRISVDDGRQEILALQPRAVADFHTELMGRMRSLGLEERIWTLPCEVEHPIRFEDDHQNATYDADFANRFWRVLVQADRVLTLFRARFLGKVSPVHFFWGSFDLAVTRFSGRRAPPHPGAPNIADKVTREAYSHEVSSAGFWPGSAGLSDPVFYAYAYPEPNRFAQAAVAPAAASYNAAFGEFLLHYEAVRQAAAPDDLLLEFLQSTYEAAADLGRWARAELERA